MSSTGVLTDAQHTEVIGWSDVQRQGNAVQGCDETMVAVPPHPLRIKPTGNAYTSSSNLKSATGYFTCLPDELIVQILEYLEARNLLQLGATCKALYAFARFEDLWKSLFIEYVSTFSCVYYHSLRFSIRHKVQLLCRRNSCAVKESYMCADQGGFPLGACAGMQRSICYLLWADMSVRTQIQQT